MRRLRRAAIHSCVWLGIAGMSAACRFSPGEASGADAHRAIDAPGDAAIDTPGCPSMYKPLPNAPSKYRVVTAGGTWVSSQAICRNDGFGTHLAIAETAAEDQAIIDALSGASGWLGVTDRKVEGTWRPIVDEITWYPHWFQGMQPANNTNYNCLMMSGPPFEEAMPCDDPDPQWHRGFICECDGNAVDPATF